MLYRLIIIICLVFIYDSCVMVQAATSEKSKKVEKVKRPKTISKSSAIRIARNEFKGKILSAQLIKSRGPAVYRVKMLVGESRVRTVFVDGVRGKVIRNN